VTLSNNLNPHIVLVISSLASGGAERVLSTIANYWSRNGNRVTLITLNAKGCDFYETDEKIERIGLDVFRPSKSIFDALLSNYKRYSVLRRALKNANPDIIISFVDRTNVLTLLSSTGLSIPVVVSERIDPRSHPAGKGFNKLRRFLYRKASTVVAQTDSVKNWMMDYLGTDNVVSFPNPIDIGKSAHIESNDILQGNVIVTVGRLWSQKGHDVLITAFSRVVSHHPDWRLVIFGEGYLRDDLEKMVKELGLENSVFLPGRVKNPENIIGNADIFVLSSRYEGFPNALLEAMACSLPVISTDCNSGPSEIINNNVDGILVPTGDDKALSDSLIRLINNPGDRHKLGTAASESVKRYSLDKIMGLWNELIDDVINSA